MKDTDVSPNVACSRRRFLTVSAAGLLVAGLPACSDSEDAGIRFTDTITYGRQAIQRHMIEAPDSPAVSVALLWKEQIVWREAFGLASVTDKEPATVHTRFNIGSVSKVFAGLTGVILRDQGVLDLDAPVAQYLPEFTMLSPEFAQITSRQLLSHSSGLPGTNVRRVFSFAPMPGYAQDTQAGLAHFHLKHRPGEMAVYCNDGFTLFELVVLTVSGLTYPEFVRRYIFEPLEMTRSGYLLSVPTNESIALPYKEGAQFPIEYVNAYATGGVCSTPSDMMNFARMFVGNGSYRGRRIVSPEGIAEMATDQAASTALNPTPWPWGLGWDAVRQPAIAAAGELAWQKNGGTAFFETEFFVLPEAELAFLITGNAGYRPLEIAEEVMMRALIDAR